MEWLFALGIIWLAVVHEGFRKVVLWFIGIVGGGFILLSAVVAMTNGH